MRFGFLLLLAPALFAQGLLIPSPSGSQPGEIRVFAPAGNQTATAQPVSFDPVVTVILKPWTATMKVDLLPDTELLETTCENSRGTEHMVGK